MVVLNGNGVTRLSRKRELPARAARPTGHCRRRRGVIANAPPPNRFKTEVYFDPRQRGSRAAARSVRNLFGSAVVKADDAEIAGFANTAMLVVVVGTTFHNTSLLRRPTGRRSASRRTQSAIPRPRSAASSDPSPRGLPAHGAEPDRAQAQALHFENPVRIYAMKKGERAVRMTFRTGTRSTGASSRRAGRTRRCWRART